MPERFSPAQPNYLRFVSTPTIDIEPFYDEVRGRGRMWRLWPVFMAVRLTWST